MRILLRLMLGLAALIGTDQYVVELSDGSRVRDLKKMLIERLSIPREIVDNIVVLRDGVGLDDDDELRDGDTLTLLPSVSGG